MNEYISHPSQAPWAFPQIKAFPDKLYVVTAISNPIRYKSRYRLYRAFEKRCLDAGAILYTVEMAYGGRDFELTEREDRHDVQVRGTDELWYKENLLNVGIRHLPPEAKYIAVVDGDFTFVRPDWAQETIQQLQHFPVVQMFSNVTYLNPNEEPLHSNISFMEAYLRGMTFCSPMGKAKKDIFFHHNPCDYKTGFGAPGGAWAYRREALDSLGCLIDFSILGSADYQMATALIGQMDLSISPGLNPVYRELLLEWQARAERHIRRSIGCMPGLVLHHWHGKMKDRRYGDRWKILVKHQYNPITDLKTDSQGIYRLEDDGSLRYCNFRDDLKAYFRCRNEDSIDI